LAKRTGGAARGEIDVAGTGFTRHGDDFAAGGAAYDGVIHQQHVFAFEFHADGVEFLAHRFFALGLARHDEGAADIAVFDEAFAIRDAQALGEFHGSRAAGVGNRDD
jgi:hypothetical protein